MALKIAINGFARNVLRALYKNGYWEKVQVVSNASCTPNCQAPLAQTLNSSSRRRWLESIVPWDTMTLSHHCGLT